MGGIAAQSIYRAGSEQRGSLEERRGVTVPISKCEKQEVESVPAGEVMHFL